MDMYLLNKYYRHHKRHYSAEYLCTILYLYQIWIEIHTLNLSNQDGCNTDSQTD